ncbi:MAG: LptF/LptG family permease [Promethearchaeota archaeon]
MFDLSLLANNWQNILIAFAVSAFFYVLSNYAIKKYLRSAEKERIDRAKTSLLDILESRIINKQNITFNKIDNLIRATERDHLVNLQNVITPRSILEDLELIFEKSHHLDANQKNEYCQLIQNEIGQIDEMKKVAVLNSSIPAESTKIFEKLALEINSNDTESALESLDLLKKQYLAYKKTFRVEIDEKITTLLSIIIAVLAFAFASIDFSSSSFKVFGIVLIVFVFIGYVYFVFKKAV